MRNSKNLFTLSPIKQSLPTTVGAMVVRPLEKMLALPGINGVYDRVSARINAPTDFAGMCIEDLDVDVNVSTEDLERIPRTGPIVVVANHPFGGVEGLILTNILLKQRPDTRVLVNHLLGAIPEMHAVSIFVDNFGTDKHKSARGLKQALHLLRNGGCLGVFPSGAVSHLHLSTRTIEDPKWSQHIGGLIRRTGAAVVPLFFEGNNGPLFQLAGLIHPRLRTALLPRQVLNKRSTTCKIQIGRVISAREIATFPGDPELVDYLRNRTYALKERQVTARAPHWRRVTNYLFHKKVGMVDLALPGDTARLEREIASLPSDNLLIQSNDFKVYHTTAAHMPLMMRELGRLREMTFRVVGEGTGRAIDVDEFDQTYHHLIVWNTTKRELVGAYRLGLADVVTAGVGNSGLYVNTLFKMAPDFLQKLGPAIELGRSFVRTEYQRSFSPLMLLWKGIGEFVARHPKYRYLFGPVSISNTYSPLSRALIVDFMTRDENRSPLSDMLEPRTPFKVRRRVLDRAQLLSMPLQEFEHLNDLVGDIERDGKSVPVLLKQYAKLGAKSLGFNIDPAFGQCLDCLCVLDLVNADRRSIDRFMGKESVKKYLAAQQALLI